jgi:hypothetical protein
MILSFIYFLGEGGNIDASRAAAIPAIKTVRPNGTATKETAPLANTVWGVGRADSRFAGIWRRCRERDASEEGFAVVEKLSELWDTFSKMGFGCDYARYE